MTRKLTAPGPAPIVLRGVQPNAGVEAAYRARLQQMVDDMQFGLLLFLRQELRPVLAADDDSGWRAPSWLARLRAAMNKMTKLWLDSFDRGAGEVAEWFVNRAYGASDAQLKAILRDAGFTVPFKMTPALRATMGATVTENVSLIKSIASEHLTKVEGMVMRSVSTGRDLGQLSTDLQEQFGVTRKRAAFIALHQNNAATAAITRARQKALGINKALWQHSGAGKEPRPSHVAANNKPYDVEKGMFLDGEWCFPGQLINCRCLSKSIIPGFEE